MCQKYMYFHVQLLPTNNLKAYNLLSGQVPLMF